MQELLRERRNKLQMTEKKIEHKGNVVAKVEKLLHGKERKANYIEKKNLETVMFSQPKKEPE